MLHKHTRSFQRFHVIQHILQWASNWKQSIGGSSNGATGGIGSGQPADAAGVGRRGADAGTDHHLLVGTFRLELARNPESYTTKNKRYDVKKLKQPETRNNIPSKIGL